MNDDDGFFVATVRTGKTQLEMTPQVEQLMQRVHSLFEQYVKLQQSLNHETMAASVRTDEPAKLADTIAANLQLGSKRSSSCWRCSIRRRGWRAWPMCWTSRSRS